MGELESLRIGEFEYRLSLALDLARKFGTEFDLERVFSRVFLVGS